MAAVPNQNDIVRVIKSQVECLDAVIGVIVKSSSSSIIANSKAHMANIKSYQTMVDTVFGKEGIGTMLANAVKSIEQLSSMKPISFRALKRTIRRLNKFTSFISKLNFDSGNIDKVKEQIKPFNEFVTEIQTLFSTFEKIKPPSLFSMKFLLIKITLWRIVKLGTSLAMLNAAAPILVASMASIKLLSKLIAELNKMFESLNGIKIGIKTLILIKVIPFVLRRMFGIIRAIGRISRFIMATGGLKDALILSAVFNMLESVFESIGNTKVGLMMRLKIKRMCRVILMLNRVVRLIARIRIRPKALVKLIILKLLFINLGMVLLSVIILAPIMLLAIPAMLILLLGLFVFKFVLRMILRIIVRLARAWVLRGLLALLVIGTVLTMLAVMFFVIAMLAKPVVKNALCILGLLGVILLVAIIMVIIGGLFGLLSPIFMLILVGLGIMTLVIFTLLLMAVMLRLIQMLDLDAGKITENIEIVVTTALSIIDIIFQRDDVNKEESKRGWIAKIIDYIGGGISLVVQAIMAVAFLAVMVAAILSILLIATMLRLIQELDLDDQKIYENVNIVIDTCTHIIDLLFEPSDVNGKASNKSWLESVLDYIGSGLVMVIKAIMAVAFLALMVAAIGFILLIATMLRLLQILDLDVPKIEANVKIVLDTVQKVIDILYNGDGGEDKASNKSWLERLLDYIGSGVIMVIKAVMAVAFLALMVAAIAMILLLATMLRGLEEINLDSSLISANVNTCINTAIYVIDSLYNKGDRDTGESSKGWLLSVLEWLCSPLAMIIQAIMTVIFLALSIAAIALVMVLARQLSELQGMILDEATITGNVDTCINTAFHVINAIMDPEERADKPSTKSWLRRVLEFCGGGAILDIIDAIMAMAWLGLAVGIIYLVRMLAEHLEFIGKLNLPNNITSKVDAIINTANSVISMVTNRKDPLETSGNKKKAGLLRRLFPRLAEIADMLSRMRWVSSVISTVGVVQQVAETLLLINNIPDIKGIAQKAQHVCDTADEIAKMVTQRTGVDIESSYSRLTFLERINKVVRSLGSISEGAIRKTTRSLDGYSNLLQKINDVDQTKLEQTVKMFEHMANFARTINGDFKELAETINEELAPTLIDIRDLLTRTSTSISSSTAAITALQQTVATTTSNSRTAREIVGDLMDNNQAGQNGTYEDGWWQNEAAYQNAGKTVKYEIDKLMRSQNHTYGRRILKLLKDGGGKIKTCNIAEW